MNHHAVDGFKQRQFDKILPLDEAAGRRRRGDHEQRVAGVGIDQPMQDAGAGQRHADIGERRIGDVAQHRQRQRRRLHPVGEVSASSSLPPSRLSLSSEGICGRLRRMRIAWPFSSGTRLTSPMMAPPLARIGSISMGWSGRTPATRCRRGGTAPRASAWQRKMSRAGRRCRAAPRRQQTCRWRGFPADARPRPASFFGAVPLRAWTAGGASFGAEIFSGARRGVVSYGRDASRVQAGAFSAAGAACSAAGAAFSVARRGPFRRWRWLVDLGLLGNGLRRHRRDRRRLLLRHRLPGRLVMLRPAPSPSAWPAQRPRRNRSLRRGGPVRFCHAGFSACWKATSTT